jgi:hypothetical protein
MHHLPRKKRGSRDVEENEKRFTTAASEDPFFY